ncbi:MAG: flavodoxin [Clostridiales bacterium]|nr:flavodoxin [Clostridiales bacterium]
MKKTAIVYWSGTGNTEQMANAVLQGVQSAGAEGTLMQASDFNSSLMDNYNAVAFGCPAMGAEELEDSEFEPMFSECEAKLSGKQIALFGSYGCGTGEWMNVWKERCENDGTVLVSDPVIANYAPDDDVLDLCKALGNALANC